MFVGAGNCFLIVMRGGFPISVRRVPEVCRVFCASANPVEVIVARSQQGGGIVG